MRISDWSSDVCSSDLGRYMKDLTAHPAMQLTPETVGDRIAVAAQSARRADQDQIVQSRTELQHATRELRAITNHARTTADQRAIVMGTAIASVLAGALLWSFLPGSSEEGRVGKEWER